MLLNGSLSDGVANNNVEKLETAFAQIKGGDIIDLEIGPDGLVYIVSSNGKIMRLEPMPFKVRVTGYNRRLDGFVHVKHLFLKSM